jgi:exodeoxyribonuclease III
MKIVTWNVNSIKARREHVLRYLAEENPDVLMIQELKGTEFPHDDFKSAGYDSLAVGQKAYNGVAILSKNPITEIARRLDGEPEDEQARYLEVEINGVRLINIYLPNGNPTPGDKYDYKLRWMERLYNRLKSLTGSDTQFIIGGDFNVIPEGKDCKNPAEWKDDALFRPETHAAFRAILNLGLTDAFRVLNTAAGQYSFWDYQRGAWQKDNGIRIDHFLLSPHYADRLISCRINKNPRGLENASDHTPIELEIC